MIVFETTFQCVEGQVSSSVSAAVADAFDVDADDDNHGNGATRMMRTKRTGVLKKDRFLSRWLRLNVSCAKVSLIFHSAAGHIVEMHFNFNFNVESGGQNLKDFFFKKETMMRWQPW